MAYLKHLLNKWIIYINKLRLASTLDFLTVHRIWHMKFGNLTQVWIWIFQTEIRKRKKTRKWKQMGKWVIRSATPLHQTHFPHSLTFSPGTYLHSSWPAWSHLFFFLLCTYLHPASTWRWLVEPLQQIPLLSELVTNSARMLVVPKITLGRIIPAGLIQVYIYAPQRLLASSIHQAP